MSEKRKPTITTPVPRISDDPALSQAAARLKALRIKASELTQRVDAISATEHQDDRQAAIAAVLAGEDVTLAARNTPSATAREQLVAELDIVRGAILMAERAVDEARRRAQAAAVEAVAPRVRDLSARMARTLCDLARLQAEALELDEDLRANGVKWPTDRAILGMAQIGIPGDDYGLLTQWLALAVYHEVLDESELPSEVRESGVLADFLRIKQSGEGRGADRAAVLARAQVDCALPDGRARSLQRQFSRARGGLAR